MIPDFDLDSALAVGLRDALANFNNPGETQYQVMPGTQRRKFDDTDPMNMGRGVDTFTIQLDPKCGRKRYRDLKNKYRAVRVGDRTLLAR